MPRPRNVIDLLVEQSEEALMMMLDAAKAELTQRAIEVKQIEEALARKTRRNRGGTSGSRLTKEQVFAVVDRSDEPLSPAQVHEALVEQGVPASLNSVRNHLARLVDQHGWLRRTDEGRFVGDPEPKVSVPLVDLDDFPAAAKDDDIPF